MNDAQHAKSLKSKYGKRIAALKKHKRDVELEIDKLTSKYQSKCRHSKMVIEQESGDVQPFGLPHQFMCCQFCGFRILHIGR